MASFEGPGEVTELGHKVLKKHFLKLLQAVLRDQIPDKFYAEDLIDQEMMDVVINPSFTDKHKARHVIKQLQSSVQLMPGAFFTIVRILDEDDSTKDLAAALRGTLLATYIQVTLYPSL